MTNKRLEVINRHHRVRERLRRNDAPQCIARDEGMCRSQVYRIAKRSGIPLRKGERLDAWGLQ